MKEMRTTQKSEAPEKTQGAVPGRKRDHTGAISETETYVEPKEPREHHLSIYLEPYDTGRRWRGRR